MCRPRVFGSLLGIIQHLINTSYSSHPPRKIYLYNKANFHQLRADMCSFQQTFFNSQPELLSVNRNWTMLKESLTAAVDRNVPSRVTFSHRRHPPWLTKSVRKTFIMLALRVASAVKHNAGRDAVFNATLNANIIKVSEN